MFYALEYPYGRFVVDANTGHAICHVWAFDSLADRNAWAIGGPSYTTESGYRENALARHKEVRRAIRTDCLKYASDYEHMVS